MKNELNNNALDNQALNDSMSKYKRLGQCYNQPYNITYTEYSNLSKIDIQNVEVTQELMDELSKLVLTGNISLSLQGVTIKKVVEDKYLQTPVEDYSTRVTKPKSQKTEISDEEFDQVVAAWKQVKGDEIELLNDTIETFNGYPEFQPEENLLNLMEDSQTPQPIGEEVLEKVITDIDGVTPDTKEFLVSKELESKKPLTDLPLSIMEVIELEMLEAKEKLSLGSQLNKNKRIKLNNLRNKYKL